MFDWIQIMFLESILPNIRWLMTSQGSLLIPQRVIFSCFLMESGSFEIEYVVEYYSLKYFGRVNLN